MTIYQHSPLVAGLPIAGNVSSLRLLQATVQDTYVIYGLLCPLSGALRYVGITNDVVRRMREHLKNTCGTLGKKDWLEYLDSLGLTPHIVLLDTASSKAQAEKKERQYIYHFTQHGEPITNFQIAWFPQNTLDLQLDQETNWLETNKQGEYPRFRYRFPYEHIQPSSLWCKHFKIVVRYWMYNATQHHKRITTTRGMSPKAYNPRSRYC